MRLAYAGESTMESKRVVSEDGSEDSERLKDEEEFSAVKDGTT